MLAFSAFRYGICCTIARKIGRVENAWMPSRKARICSTLGRWAVRLLGCTSGKLSLERDPWALKQGKTPKTSDNSTGGTRFVDCFAISAAPETLNGTLQVRGRTKAKIKKNSTVRGRPFDPTCFCSENTRHCYIETHLTDVLKPQKAKNNTRKKGTHDTHSWHLMAPLPVTAGATTQPPENSSTLASAQRRPTQPGCNLGKSL